MESRRSLAVSKLTIPEEPKQQVWLAADLPETEGQFKFYQKEYNAQTYLVKANEGPSSHCDGRTSRHV